MLHSLQELVAKTYILVRPYGLKRLLIVFFFVFSQGVFQVLGVTSIFPFLSLAANPGIVRDSRAGAWIYEMFPGVTDQQLLIAAGIAVVISLVLANVMNLVSELVRTLYVHRFSHWLRMRLVWRYLSRPYGYFLENHTGVMMKKINGDVNSFTSSVLLSLLDSCARAITAVLLFGTLFIVSWKIALVATIILIGYYLAIFTLLRGRRKILSDGINDANRGCWVTLQSLFGGIKPMMVHGVHRTFADAYSAYSMKVVKLAPRMPFYANSPRYFIEPILFGGMTIFIIILIGRGEDINALLPQLGVIGLAGYRLLPAAQLLYGQLSQIDAMRYSLEEVYDEFRVAEDPDSEPSLPDLQYSDPSVPPLTIREELRFDNVTFSYPKSDHPAVDRVSLRIKKGSSVAFVGHSGSGKSTLVDLMIGLHRPKSGAIWIDDRQLTEDSLPAWRKSLGYVPQDIFLIDASIAQNIAFGVPVNQIDRQRVREVAAQAQILEFIESELPKGLDTEVGERGVRLSGGQRQRIGLARALYHRPETLVLDEATSALDSRTESAFMRAVESLQGQVTIVMIAHRLTTVEKCDCIFLMDHGRLVEQGTYQELLRESSNFAALAAISHPDDEGETGKVGA